MKKISKICCSNSDIDVEQPQPIRRRDPRLEKPLEQPYMSGSNMTVLHVMKEENIFFVKKIRFFPNGDLHSIMISFDDEDDGRKMQLIIDGEPFYDVNIEQQFEGNTELNIDGMVVDFVWDVARTPNKFSFYIRAVGSSSYNDDDDDDNENDGHAKDWEDHVHEYLLKIIEIEG